MNNLELGHLRRLREELESGTLLEDALPKTVGAKTVSGGLWRLFSEDVMGAVGIKRWNEYSTWKCDWEGFLSPEMFCFGEDAFGNQLVALPGHDNAMLWLHENSELCDLFVNPLELLETVLGDGLDWIDCYGNGSLRVAESTGLPPLESHLHWTTPIILGGRVSVDNVSVVERVAHLTGHGKLWAQVSDVEPGARIIPE